MRRGLAEAEAFVSAQTLHARLAEGGTFIGLATVYRALAQLAEEALADTVQAADGTLMYRACDMRHHHHHLICRACGRAVEIEADAVEAWAEGAAEAHGFSEPEHVVDVFGLCAECRSTC